MLIRSVEETQKSQILQMPALLLRFRILGKSATIALSAVEASSCEMGVLQLIRFTITRKRIDTYIVVSLSTKTSILIQVIKPATWLNDPEMNGLVVSLIAETFLNTGPLYLVTKPSSY